MNNIPRRKITAAVTALNAIDSPGPGMAVIRALREAPEFETRIIGLSYESLEPGIYMKDMVDKTYQIPYPSAGSDVLFARLKHIHSREKIDVIIPNFDSELLNFIKISEKLKALGISSFLPTAKQLESRDKISLYRFCQKHKFNTPKDRIIYKSSEINKAVEELGAPFVVKGKFYEASIANSVEQAHKEFHRISAKWGTPVIIQEFVNGIEINISAVGDGKGGLLSVVPMRKLYITDKGKAWAGITLGEEDFVDLAKKFARATKWKGGFELELIRSQKDAWLYILEVNPRFPSWVYLTVAAGQNQPSALVKLALNMKVNPYRKYEVGKIFIRYSWDMITDVETFQKISAYGEY